MQTTHAQRLDTNKVRTGHGQVTDASLRSICDNADREGCVGEGVLSDSTGSIFSEHSCFCDSRAHEDELSAADGGSVSFEVSDTSMYDLFWQVWPLMHVWLAEQQELAADKWHLRRHLRAYFREWVQEAAIFPPPLVTDSESDPGDRYVFGPSDLYSDDSDDSSDSEFDASLAQFFQRAREAAGATQNQSLSSTQSLPFTPWEGLRESFVEPRGYLNCLLYLRPGFMGRDLYVFGGARSSNVQRYPVGTTGAQIELPSVGDFRSMPQDAWATIYAAFACDRASDSVEAISHPTSA